MRNGGASIGLFALFALAIVPPVMLAGKWEPPWSAVGIVTSALFFLIAGAPMACVRVVKKMRARRAQHGEAEVEREVERAIVISVMAGAFGFLLFFLLGFTFLLVFHALRRTAVLQLVAMLVYQLVAHIGFKKLLVPILLCKLPESMLLDAFAGMTVFYEIIAELFLSFAFPSVDSYFILVVAAFMEVFLFTTSVRRMHHGWARFEDRVILSLRSKRTAAITPIGNVDDDGESEDMLPSTVTGTSNGFAATTTTLGSKEEEKAFALGGNQLVAERRVTSFGALFLFELGSAITFTVFYTAMCFGPNAVYFQFGSEQNGRCNATDYFPPMIVAFGTFILHIFAFVPTRSYLIRNWQLDPWTLSLDWVRRSSHFVFVIVPSTVTQLVAFLLLHYGLRETMQGVVE